MRSADFAGLLAPPRRLWGMYIGRDGPPGYNYYALPAYIPLVDFAAMGFWREEDTELLQQLETFIADKNDMQATNWNAMVSLMRKRLATAMSGQIRGKDYVTIDKKRTLRNHVE